MNAIVQAQAELILTILSGPDKGVSYKVVSTRITLGRASDNSVILKDPRSSRHHAVIELTPEGIFVEDISSHDGIDVDGTLTKRTVLKSGSHITLGTTVLRFDVKSQQAPNLPASMPGGSSLGNHQSAPPALTSEQKNKRAFYVILGVSALIVVWFLSNTVGKKKEDVPIRSDAIIDEEIKASQERKEAIQKQQQAKGIGTLEYAEAQASYLQGFRDYREGNYARALLSFDAVLALNPKHELAYKYRDLSKRRLDELIEKTMLAGKRYMEQSKYELAKNAYQQVMILINDPRSKLYQEAREYYNECILLMKGAY